RPVGKVGGARRAVRGPGEVGGPDATLGLVARQAQGSMRDALGLLDQLGVKASDEEAAQLLGVLGDEIIHQTVQAGLDRDAGAALNGVQRAWEQGAEMKRLAEEAAQRARNLALPGLPRPNLHLPPPAP